MRWRWDEVEVGYTPSGLDNNDFTHLGMFSSYQVEAYPGQVISLAVKATDELGRPTASTFRIQDSAERVSCSPVPRPVSHDLCLPPPPSHHLYSSYLQYRHTII